MLIHLEKDSKSKQTPDKIEKKKESIPYYHVNVNGNQKEEG